MPVNSGALGQPPIKNLAPLGGSQTFPLVVPRLGIAYRFENGLNLDLSTSAAPYGLARTGAFFGIRGHTDFPP